MGFGTSSPPTTPATPAVPASTAPSGQAQGQGLTPQQIQAITMVLSNVGKSPSIVGGMQSTSPQAVQTQTLQGGTYFNPNRQ